MKRRKRTTGTGRKVNRIRKKRDKKMPKSRKKILFPKNQNKLLTKALRKISLQAAVNRKNGF